MSFDDKKCWEPKHFYKYFVDEFSQVEGATIEQQEMSMMKEIFHRGPISCGIAVPDALMNYTSGNMFFGVKYLKCLLMTSVANG